MPSVTDTLPPESLSLLISELFHLEIPAFGREILNSAEVRESFLADPALQKCSLSLLGESKSGFSPKVSPGFEMLLAYR
jgi:hypothetical protein